MPQNQHRPNHELYRIAFVQSNWHSDIVDQAKISFLDAVSGDAETEVFQVPACLATLAARELVGA